MIDLYYFPPSPPCRAVMLTAKAVGVKLNLKLLNITEGEHMNAEFVKLNPEHTIPTIVDNGVVAWESRAIMSYLVDMYAENDSLYPKDPQQRLMVDQRLYFDIGTLYNRLVNYFIPVAFAGAKPDENQRLKVEEALQTLNKLLESYEWVAGFGMTIADITIIVSVSTAEAVGFNISKFSNVSEWYERCKKALQPFEYEEINQVGANTLGGIFRSKLR
ncbi:glutathione S-transferase D7-like [Chrysoperla carnea]|uniref:glutathione S-transferase D7-like n=1 Tax=Chrysoperla carnea TaxID=189513 RepID=UPI001D08D4E1|nr:glutathione S-transferase D7-like [Chrysoperla carnea]XP_044741250.1 glutathione S-transferase D7-like [Chrysoperla carnea]